MDIAKLIECRASSEIVTCDVDMPVRDVVALLDSRRIGALPVMKAGEVVGIFSERDVVHRMASEGAAFLEQVVGDVMTSPAITVERGTKVDDALALMTHRRIRHLPVLDGATMCGFVSIGDLVKSRIDEIEIEAAQMRQYISTA
ncbi:histidine kinase [Erythrobacter sp. QSSC1-22B]|uniref:CBS domain-containing protein n=1 Tax=Erythrobacter sp. QSSC1-22B TaxID=1860125 RepID=UPI0008059293|nr:CBS domain-containing protein [Erythrobacter sp. QSSC1-22B]OBX20013.1 histidine kinase [Erythrobacter sp. QSSC1-22B]